MLRSTTNKFNCDSSDFLRNKFANQIEKSRRDQAKKGEGRERKQKNKENNEERAKREKLKEGI